MAGRSSSCRRSHNKRVLEVRRKSLWIYASYHWLFVAVLAAVAVAHPSRLARTVFALAALLLTGDVILLFVAVGPFIGEVLLAVSIATYVAGAFLLRPKR